MRHRGEAATGDLRFQIPNAKPIQELESGSWPSGWARTRAPRPGSWPSITCWPATSASRFWSSLTATRASPRPCAGRGPRPRASVASYSFSLVANRSPSKWPSRKRQRTGSSVEQPLEVLIGARDGPTGHARLPPERIESSLEAPRRQAHDIERGRQAHHPRAAPLPRLEYGRTERGRAPHTFGKSMGIVPEPTVTCHYGN